MQSQQPHNQSLEGLLIQFINKIDAPLDQTESTLKSQAASIQNFEVQVGQLANLLSSRPQGALPSNTETNVRENV